MGGFFIVENVENFHVGSEKSLKKELRGTQSRGDPET
jgi:hypothetical protein